MLATRSASVRTGVKDALTRAGPLCGERLDAAASPDDASPVPGDVAICVHCGTFLSFTERLQLRRLRPVEQAAMQRQEPELWAALQRMRTAVEAGTWRRHLKGS